MSARRTGTTPARSAMVRATRRMRVKPRADNVGEKAVRPAEFLPVAEAREPELPLTVAKAKVVDYDECLACQ